jgi:capsular exopolysaccharide synthesis family protein
LEGEGVKSQIEEGGERVDSPSLVATYPVVDRYLLAPLWDPQAQQAEQYRSVKARVEYLGRVAGKPLQVLVVTSPSPGDGKTLTALNLSLVLSQDTARDTLLIEADLRRPSMRGFFEDAPREGLVEVLNNEIKLSTALIRPEGSRLLILPAGARPSHPAELLASPKMLRLLQILRRRFDYIVLDTPPVTAVVDADQLSSQADGVIMVVRAAATPRKLVRKAMDVVAKHPVVGIILNDVKTTPIDRYYHPYDSDYDYKERKK